MVIHEVLELETHKAPNYLEGTIRNISGAGIGVEAPSRLPVATVVRCDASLLRPCQ